MKDDIGDRMKSQYEDRCRYMLPRRTNTILRLDGVAFHTYTKGMEKPYCGRLHDGLLYAAKGLASIAQGCKFGYVQSDEASFLLTDYDRIETSAWFDGNMQKLASVSASIFTASFNGSRVMDGVACFDCRVFTIPDSTEVENYFIWRQKDAIRNSISMLAQNRFSPRQLHGKSTRDMLNMLEEDAIEWSECPEWARNGSLITREEKPPDEDGGPIRHSWQIRPSFKFLEDRNRLTTLIVGRGVGG